MLIHEPLALIADDIATMIARLNGNRAIPVELQTGVYQLGHFGSSHWPSDDYEPYPRFAERGPYGVADSVEQILTHYPELTTEGREFILTVTPVLKANQSPDGGWRWHKWGEYIGTHLKQCEYLYDEVGIDGVLCYHIYEKR